MVENYQEAIESNEKYELHHRLELTLDGQFAHSHEELERLGMYWHRPYFELIFIKHDEHRRMHSTGRQWTDNTRKKQKKWHEDFWKNRTDEDVSKLRSRGSKWRWKKIQEMGYDAFINSRSTRK